VYDDARDVFDRLDFDDDATFLEPAAFAAAATGTTSPAELALVFAASARPAELTATTDTEGRVFLPGLGYLGGLEPSTSLRLARDDASPVGYGPGWPIPLADWRVSDATTLLPYPAPLLEVALPAAIDGVENAAKAHREPLERALSLIRSGWPELADAIGRVVRYVVVFDDPALNSFAAPPVHGAAFLDVAHGTTPAYFVEDLAHQCGHVLFTAAWEGAEPLVEDPDADVATLLGRDDHRTIEVALHGMVTQTLMVAMLERLLDSDADVDPDEVTGRLLFALLRLGLDLHALAGLPVYTEPGQSLVRALAETYQPLAERYGDLVVATDWRSQPYNFDYAIYRARNPAPAAAPRA